MERLTSRKFLIGILVIVLALAGWVSGNLAYGDMVQAALWVAGLFMGAEGLADAAGRLRPSPPAPVVTPQADTTTVNVEAPNAA
jgi:hypothetical protein